MELPESEADPATAEDPLDCSKENGRNDGFQDNWILFEPDTRFDGKMEESSLYSRSSPRLRVMRQSKDVFSEAEDNSDCEWRPARVKRTKGRKQVLAASHGEGKTSESETDSDEENTIPTNRKKLRWGRKPENYVFCDVAGKEEAKFPCQMCDKTFAGASVLDEHIVVECQADHEADSSKEFGDANSLITRIENARNGEDEDGKDKEKVRSKEESFNRVKVNPPSEKNERCRKYYEQLKTERKYQCEICQKTFITSGHLNTHMYRHSGKKWKCDGCGKNFSCERSLLRHKDTFPGNHWFPCKFCDMTFFRILNFAKHMEIKHPEAPLDGTNDINLNLKQNEMKTDKSDDANSSKMCDSGGSGKDFVCEKCLKTFQSSEMLFVHNKAMHSPKKEEKSKGENEGDPREEGEKHRDSKSDPESYKCEICSKEFVSFEGFDYHKNHQHIEKESKKRRKRKMSHSNDGDAINDESSPANFICKICSAPFTMKSSLQTHLKSHNVTKNVEVRSGSHQCCICPRSFTSSDGLKYHLATHTGERRFSCDQCGKRFIKKTHLSEHIATHSEVKYFKCPRCPRTFSTHSAYKKHIKHFPGPHSFPCSKCGKLFTKESMIEKHMCVDLVKITMAPEVKALLSEDMIEEYLCLAEEHMVQELSMTGESERNDNGDDCKKQERRKDNASHSCYKCFKIFPNLSSLQEHQNDHIGKQKYQCRFCPESFKRADAFGAHIRNHLGSTPYMCLKCNRKFISPFTLSMHAKNYPGDHSFTCQKCQRWFPSEKRLDKHECILQNAEFFTCACGSTFSNWNQLLQHAGTKPYKCCSCELKYPTLTALARHIKKHTGVKPFSCEICGKSFRAKNNYLNHKNIHRDLKEIQCEHCEYKSKSQKRMDFHLFRKHDVGSNFGKSTLCPICGLMFPYGSQMRKHLELEHGNELMFDETSRKSLPSELCTLCGKMLNNKYILANHMKKVHDPNASKKERKIKCEVGNAKFCEEKFRTVKKLQHHAEIHEEPGLRDCEICHKEFYFAKELRKHMKKHDTNKPYSCPRCGKHFKVSVSLKYHSTICGNVIQRTPSSRRKKELKEPSMSVLYGHIDPVDLNNQSCMLQIYGR